MGREKEFDNILDECLDYILDGGDIEACLAQHPEHAAELEPLLRTALETRNAAAIKPNPEFRQRAGNEFQAAIREMPSKAPRSAFRWQVRWMTPLAVVIVLLMAGSGTVAAASNSLPDSPLYQVKLATESIQLAFTPSDLGKAELYARFTDRRVDEIIRMAAKGKVDQIEKITERMDNQLIAMANLTSTGETFSLDTGSMALQAPAVATPAPTILATPEETPAQGTLKGTGPPEGVGRENTTNGKGKEQKPGKQEKLRTMLTERFEENLKILQDELAKAPEWLKPALQQAIEVARRGYERALLNLE